MSSAVGMQKTYYEILELKQSEISTMDEKDIKKAIVAANSKLSLQWHPDKNTLILALKDNFLKMYPDVGYETAKELFGTDEKGWEQQLEDKKSAVNRLEALLQYDTNFFSTGVGKPWFDRYYQSTKDAQSQLSDADQVELGSFESAYKRDVLRLSDEEWQKLPITQPGRGNAINELVEKKRKKFLELWGNQEQYTKYRQFFDIRDLPSLTQYSHLGLVRAYDNIDVTRKELELARGRVLEIAQQIKQRKELVQKYKFLEENIKTIIMIQNLVRDNFELVNEAYATLIDSVKRTNYNLNQKTFLWKDIPAVTLKQDVPRVVKEEPKAPGETKELILDTYRELLDSHIRKIAPNVVYKRYKKGDIGPFTWIELVNNIVREVNRLKTAPTKSVEFGAVTKARNQLRLLVEKLLGKNGNDFINLMHEKELGLTGYGDLTKFKEYSENFRAGSLFEYTRDIKSLYDFLSKEYPGEMFLDYPTSLAKIFSALGYTKQQVFLKLYVPYYQEIIKRGLAKDPSDNNFLILINQMLKDFNAWIQPAGGPSGDQKDAESLNRQVEKSREEVFQDAYKQYLIASQKIDPEDKSAMSKLDPAVKKALESAQALLKAGEIKSLDDLAKVPVDPGAELVKLFTQHVKNFGQKPYPKYSSKALRKEMTWQELITELVKKAMAWGPEALPGDLLATFKENLATYVAMLSTGAEKFQYLTSNQEKDLNDNVARLQALRLYVSGEDTKQLTKYLPYCDDVKELVGLTYSDPGSYSDKNPRVYRKIFELLYPSSGFGVGSYRIPSSPVRVLDDKIIHRYLGVSKESALEYLSLDFESLLSLAKYMTLTDMITKLKTVITMIDAWKFPDDYKYTEYGIKDKQGLKNKYISSIIGEYVRNTVPSDQKAADRDAQDTLVKAIIEYVKSTGVTNLTMEGLQQNIKDKKPLRFKVYAIKEALSLVVASQSNLQDKKKAQLKALEDGKIIVDEQTMTIKACLKMIGDLYNKTGEEGETWKLWEELAYYLFKVFEQLVYVPEHLLKDCTFNGAYLDKTSGERLYLLGAYVSSGYDPKIPICVRLRDADWNKNKPSRTLDLYSSLSEYSQIPNVRKYLLGEGITDKVLIIDADFLNTLLAQLKKNYEENLNKVDSFTDRLEGFFEQELFEGLQKHLENYFRSQVRSKYGYMMGSGYTSFEGSEEAKKWQAAQTLLTTWKGYIDDFDTKKADITFKIKQDFYKVLGRVGATGAKGLALLGDFRRYDTTDAFVNSPTLNDLQEQLFSAQESFLGYFATIGAEVGKDAKTATPGATNIDQLIGALNGLKNRLGELSQTLGNLTSEEEEDFGV